jgi:hypothetical protein
MLPPSLLPIGAHGCFLIFAKPVATRVPSQETAIGEPIRDLRGRGQKQLRFARLRRIRKPLQAWKPLNLPEISERPRNVGAGRSHILETKLSGNWRDLSDSGAHLNPGIGPNLAGPTIRRCFANLASDISERLRDFGLRVDRMLSGSISMFPSMYCRGRALVPSTDSALFGNPHAFPSNWKTLTRWGSRIAPRAKENHRVWPHFMIQEERRRAAVRKSHQSRSAHSMAGGKPTFRSRLLRGDGSWGRPCEARWPAGPRLREWRSRLRAQLLPRPCSLRTLRSRN